MGGPRRPKIGKRDPRSDHKPTQNSNKSSTFGLRWEDRCGRKSGNETPEVIKNQHKTRMKAQLLAVVGGTAAAEIGKRDPRSDQKPTQISDKSTTFGLRWGDRGGRKSENETSEVIKNQHKTRMKVQLLASAGRTSVVKIRARENLHRANPQKRRYGPKRATRVPQKCLKAYPKFRPNCSDMNFEDARPKNKKTG